jgi:hypothetical protein
LSQDDESLKKRISDIEEKLDSYHEKLDYLILQNNNLKHQITDNDPELKQVVEIQTKLLNSLLSAAKMPTFTAQSASITDKYLEKFPYLKFDSISKSIIIALESKERLNLSQLTEEVRKERGSASRRIIRERVDVLIDKGILDEVDSGYGRQIELIPIEE